METMKTWRSKLKKTGASALAAFMLCGSFSAFAQEPGEETTSGEDNITMNSTNSDAELSDLTAGNVKTVTGYQTDKAVGYAANISWGNMEFVYDRGTYDSTNGTLVGSFQNRVSDVEAGATVTDGKVTSAGYWYGFDGKNNAVLIENLSTEAINITATPLVDGEYAGDAKFSLYVEETGPVDITTGDPAQPISKAWSGATAITPKHSTYLGEGENAKNDTAPGNASWKAGAVAEKEGAEGAGAISRVFAASVYDNSGQMTNHDSDVVYLNITGKPGDDFMDETTYKGESMFGDKLGTITLTFKTTGDPVKDLTPKAVE